LFLIVFYCFYFFNVFSISFWDALWSQRIIGNGIVFLRGAIFLGYSAKKSSERKNSRKKVQASKNPKNEMEMKSSKIMFSKIYNASNEHIVN